MEQRDEARFKEIMAGICEMYDKKLSAILIKTYWHAMRSFDINSFEHAVSVHMTNPDTGQWFPKPADIVKALEGNSKQKKQSVEERGEIAWSAVMGEISRIGSYGSLSLDDLQAMAAVKAMGWNKLCMMTYDQETWFKKEFISLYETYENTPLENVPKQLPGYHDLAKHKIESKKGISSIMKGLDEYRASKGLGKLTDDL